MDASAYGLGAVLQQKHAGGWKPVAYATHSLWETESRYAQIEKEALALTRACGKFTVHLLGKRFLMETDHAPLVPLLSSKHLDTLLPRILRSRHRLDRFDFSIQHIPGKRCRQPTHYLGPHFREKKTQPENNWPNLPRTLAFPIFQPVAQHSTIWSKLKAQTPYVPS